MNPRACVSDISATGVGQPAYMSCDLVSDVGESSPTSHPEPLSFPFVCVSMQLRNETMPHYPIPHLPRPPQDGGPEGGELGKCQLVTAIVVKGGV